jgi:hypothetical protein
MTTFSYGTVETALATIFRVKTARQRLTFKARLTHLQKLHVLDLTPGKGRAAKYRLEDVWRWMFALELAQLGVGPAVAVALIKAYWARALVDFFQHAAKAIEIKKPDVCVWIPELTLMSSAWDRRDRFGGVPSIGTITPSDPSDLKVIMRCLHKADQPRLCIMNLSARLRVLNAALAAAQERPSRAKSRRAGRPRHFDKRRAPDDAGVRIIGNYGT